ncbi:MAG: DMT family transporter [Fibrobacterota bacterium]
MFSRAVGRGVGFIILSCLVFCVMSVIIRMGAGLDSFQLTLFRCATGLALLCVGAMAGLFELRFVNRTALFTRGIVGGIAIYFSYLGIVKLGVAKGTLITYSYPVFTALFSVFMLGERMSLRKAGCIVTAFAGLVLLTLKGFNAGSVSAAGGFRYEPLVILGAALSGLAVVYVKKLHDTDSTQAIFFAQCLGGFWITVVPAGCAGAVGGLPAAAVLVGAGLLAAAGQLLMTEGYRTVPATTGALISLLVPAMNTAAGVVLFHEPVTATEIAGSVLILAACAGILTEGKKVPAEVSV